MKFVELACSSCCSTNSIDVIYVQHFMYNLFSLAPFTLHCTTSQDDLTVLKTLFNYAILDHHA